ncbi:hypothetical protein [Algoriphagus machipongonensis]|uniref:Uncharacterized protein n=1 Tax=Algoriphagus machipongonensis TaxID=388413 RepID=A3HT77_9BACT|nr:hypothetical protein [Algoriphagus machipongonensis]EAZ83045.1 hypothetical protein ALPR1_12530 [Algoriphagus machipongonensis]
MICGIKLKLDSRAISQLINNPNIEFTSNLNLQTAEIDGARLWSNQGITIQIKTLGYGTIKGSLHKYKNGGKHNYDDFSWEDVFLTTTNLSDCLGLNIDSLDLINLEWGLNIETDISPKQILSGLVMHKGQPFKNMYVHPGTNYTCSHAQFKVKAYDKGAQNRLPWNLLRIEMAANRSVFFNNLGVYSLNDLRRDETKANLQNCLLYGGWNDTILIEPGLTEYKPISHEEQLRISKWSNPNFWINSTKQVRYYNKKEYDNFRLKKGFVTKEKIFDSLNKKIRSFLPIYT